MTSRPETPRRRDGIRLVGLSLPTFGLAVLLAVAEVGYHRSSGCYFSGFDVWDACPDEAAGVGVVLFVLGELGLLAATVLLARAAYRRRPPKRPSPHTIGQA
jgi:hypothetical protein